MPSRAELLLLSILRSPELRERLGPLVHALQLAQLLAGAAHAGPPHPAQRGPRAVRARRQSLPRRGSITGRRPRG